MHIFINGQFAEKLIDAACINPHGKFKEKLAKRQTNC